MYVNFHQASIIIIDYFKSEAELVKDDNKKLWSDNEKDIFNQEIKSELKKQKDKEERENIAPRQSGSIQIKFTPRVFPTPSRESQNKLEREVTSPFYSIYFLDSNLNKNENLVVRKPS